MSVIITHPFQDPEADLTELQELLVDAAYTRELYIENAAMATQLTKPKGGKRKAGKHFRDTCITTLTVF